MGSLTTGWHGEAPGALGPARLPLAHTARYPGGCASERTGAVTRPSTPPVGTPGDDLGMDAAGLGESRWTTLGIVGLGVGGYHV